MGISRVWRWVVVAALTGLAGCNAPGPYFEARPATRVTVDGSVFDVRVRGRLAEALRVNREYAPRLGPIGPRAAFAMSRVSGCPVAEIRGDQALILGILACPGQTPPPPDPQLPLRYDCFGVEPWATKGAGRSYPEFECTAY